MYSQWLTGKQEQTTFIWVVNKTWLSMIAQTVGGLQHENGKGRNVELGKGRCKNKVLKKHTSGNVCVEGEGGIRSVKDRVRLETIPLKLYQVCHICVWNIYKLHCLVMGEGGLTIVLINLYSHDKAMFTTQSHSITSVYLKETSGIYQLQKPPPPFCFHSTACLTPSYPLHPNVSFGDHCLNKI